MISLLIDQSTDLRRVIVDEPLIAVSPNCVHVLIVGFPCKSTIPSRTANTLAPTILNRKENDDEK